MEEEQEQEIKINHTYVKTIFNPINIQIQMRVILFYSLISILLFSSCDDTPTIPVEEITVSENIVLGMDIDSMYQFLKESGVNSQTFSSNDELIGFYLTDVFDLNSYRNTNIQLNHFGLIYPTQLIGTNRLLGINILLSSTHQSYFQNNQNSNYLNIKQEVNERLLKDIEDLFIKKYGKPSRIKMKFFPVYQIEGRQVKEYQATPSESEILTWYTEYMTINFHKGFKSYEMSFDPSNICYTYWTTVGGDPSEIKPGSGNIYSYSLPYINYQLNDTTVKILGLEKKMKL